MAVPVFQRRLNLEQETAVRSHVVGRMVTALEGFHALADLADDEFAQRVAELQMVPMVHPRIGR